MRPQGTAEELERRRRRAVALVEQGENPAQVAKILGATLRSLRRWRQQKREGGEKGLAAKPQPGRPAFLSARQQQEVLGWVHQNPMAFGYSTELWTASRVGRLIEKRFGVHFNSHYLSGWLAARQITPQKPQRRPREKNLALIEHWLRTVWPRIKK